MSLPYSEQTQDKPIYFSIQNLSGIQLNILHKKLTDQPILATEKKDIDRIVLAIENPKPLKPESK